MGYTEKSTPFSWMWVGISFGTFILLEVFLGGFIGRFLLGKYVTYHIQMTLESVLIIFSYFLGGFLIGFLSPSVRIKEPAAGAFLAVVATFLVTLFSPYRFFSFSLQRILIGGGIAFFVAFLGARMGEKLAAALGNRASRNYFNS